MIKNSEKFSSFDKPSHRNFEIDWKLFTEDRLLKNKFIFLVQGVLFLTSIGIVLQRMLPKITHQNDLLTFFMDKTSVFSLMLFILSIFSFLTFRYFNFYSEKFYLSAGIFRLDLKSDQGRAYAKNLLVILSLSLFHFSYFINYQPTFRQFSFMIEYMAAIIIPLISLLLISQLTWSKKMDWCSLMLKTIILCYFLNHGWQMVFNPHFPPKLAYDNISRVYFAGDPYFLAFLVGTIEILLGLAFIFKTSWRTLVFSFFLLLLNFFRPLETFDLFTLSHFFISLPLLLAPLMLYLISFLSSGKFYSSSIISPLRNFSSPLI